MKTITSWFAMLALVVSLALPLGAAEPGNGPKPSEKSVLDKVAIAVTAVTGIAISPLLGTGAYGAYQYFTTPVEQRAELSWYARPLFFAFALGLAGLCAAKDALGAVLPPGFKKPLDVLEALENKVSGLVAAAAVIPLTLNSLSSALLPNEAAVHATGLAMLASLDSAWVISVLALPVGLAAFAFVWMASHAVHILILLSPWGAVDAGLKLARTTVLGLLAVGLVADPRLAAALSVVIIVVAYLVAGWAFRLTVFGSLFCWDFLTLRRNRFTPAARVNRVFSAGRLSGVPLRTYGRLEQEPENGQLRFLYRPWLVLPEKSALVTLDRPHVGRGLFFSSVRDTQGTVFLLPPRYRSHEENFAQLYHLEGGVQDAGLLKVWSALREFFSGAATHLQGT